MLKDKPAFLDRIEVYKQRSTILHKELETKYYDYSFKRTTNSKQEYVTPKTHRSTHNSIINNDTIMTNTIVSQVRNADISITEVL